MDIQLYHSSMNKVKIFKCSKDNDDDLNRKLIMSYFERKIKIINYKIACLQADRGAYKHVLAMYLIIRRFFHYGEVPEHFRSSKKSCKTEILTDMEVGLLPRSPQIIQFFSLFSLPKVPAHFRSSKQN